MMVWWSVRSSSKPYYKIDQVVLDSALENDDDQSNKHSIPKGALKFFTKAMAMRLCKCERQQ